MSGATRIIGHRGASRVAPENTLAAFRAAIAAGADGVELDVQSSRDGVPVVIHDARLERTTNGRGPVGEHTAAELAALEAGLWFDPPHGGERVPTLADVLALLGPSGLELHLELKTGHPPPPRLLPAVLEALATAGMEARTVLSSFNHPLLAEARRLAPQVPSAALCEARLIDPWAYVAAQGFQGLHPHWAMVDAELVKRCHAAGLAVRVWTVDDPAEARRLLALGVDGVITNDPARLLHVREGGA